MCEAGGDAQAQERARGACNGQIPSTSMGGLTSPSFLLHGSGGLNALQAAKAREGKAEADKEKGSKDGGQAAIIAFSLTEFPRLGDSQSMLLTNLAAIHVQDGNLGEAERCCEKALQAQPRALAPLRTLVYVLLRKGRHSQALAHLKQSRITNN